MPLLLMITALICFLTPACFLGQGTTSKCKPFTSEARENVHRYVSSYLGLPSSAVAITVDNVAETGCYISLSVTQPDAPRFHLYLSPDRAYLSSELYNLRVPPRVARLNRAKDLRQILGHGGLTLWPKNKKTDHELVVFEDFACPYCKSLDDVLKTFEASPESRDVTVVYRALPLEIHPWAFRAAELFACAAQVHGLDNHEWPINELMEFFFNEQSHLTKANIDDLTGKFLASRNTFDMSSWRSCVRENRGRRGTEEDIALASANDVSVTPTAFFDGKRITGLITAKKLAALTQDASTIPSTSLQSSRTTGGQ